MFVACNDSPFLLGLYWRNYNGGGLLNVFDLLLLLLLLLFYAWDMIT